VRSKKKEVNRKKEIKRKKLKLRGGLSRLLEKRKEDKGGEIRWENNSRKAWLG
jgi:hypothetical protein